MIHRHTEHGSTAVRCIGGSGGRGRGAGRGYLEVPQGSQRGHELTAPPVIKCQVSHQPHRTRVHLLETTHTAHRLLPHQTTVGRSFLAHFSSPIPDHVEIWAPGGAKLEQRGQVVHGVRRGHVPCDHMEPAGRDRETDVFLYSL